VAKDYYAILGLSPAASFGEIRDAYRRLAKLHHPDGDEGNENHFRQIHEAYTALSDPEQRRKHDAEMRPGSTPRRPSAPVEPLIPRGRPFRRGPEPIRPLDESYSQGFHGDTDMLSDDWFTNLWAGLGNNVFRRQGSDYYLEINLSNDEAAQGSILHLRIPIEGVCPLCRGTGRFRHRVCGYCLGHGSVEKEVPISFEITRSIPDGAVYQMPLDRYGLPDCLLTLRFHLTH